MIVESIFNLFVKFFTSVMDIINIPEIPQDVVNNISDFFSDIFQLGMQLISLVLPFDYAKFLLEIFITIEIVLHSYHFVMWIIRKIPVASIE